MEKEATILEDQSYLDLTIQTGGGLESAFDLAVRNNISITDIPKVGQKIINPNISNNQVRNYYDKKSLTPATNESQEEKGEGIEFWIVERDFIVS